METIERFKGNAASYEFNREKLTLQEKFVPGNMPLLRKGDEVELFGIPLRCQTAATFYQLGVAYYQMEAI